MLKKATYIVSKSNVLALRFVFAHGFFSVVVLEALGGDHHWYVRFSAGLWGVFAWNSVEPLRVKLSGSICSAEENVSGS